MPRTWIGNFKGPKGDAGEQGLQGPQGPQGISGEKGDPGAVDENTPITFEVPEIYQTPESGNAIKVLFGKIAKGLSDLFAAVGVLASLKTVEKSTLVTAINELAEGKFDVAKIIASTNITEPGFVMDGKTASEALAELYSNSEITGTYAYVGYFHEHTWGSQKYLATAINLPIGFDISLYNFALNNISSSGHISLDVSKFSFYQGVGTKSGQILVTTDDTYINICKEAFAAINYTITRKS